jgi:hypothetical protein
VTLLHTSQLEIQRLSQHFLSFIPDVEQEFSSLSSLIRINRTNPDNADLLTRVNAMVEVEPNLRRIADDFACSNGHPLVLMRSYCTSRSDQFSKFGTRSAVGLGTVQRTATSTLQQNSDLYVPTTTRGSLFLILAPP